MESLFIRLDFKLEQSMKKSALLGSLYITAYLNLLYLVLDDSLLMFDGGLQVFVSLQQSVAQLGSQLQV